jgi:hypothetical protein
MHKIELQNNLINGLRDVWDNQFTALRKADFRISQYLV